MATDDDGGPDPSSAAAAAAETDGPYIPAELIPNIAKHLTSLHDFFALRAGCRAYRAALPPCRGLLALQPPHLLVPHSPSNNPLSLFQLLQPNCPSFSLALFHLPQRRLLRFRARLPFAGAGGILASDGVRIVTVDDATGEILVNHLLTGLQVRLPKPPLQPDRVILTGAYIFAPATGRTDIQYFNIYKWNAQWSVSSYGSDHQIRDWRIVNGTLYALLPTCGLVIASRQPDNSMALWLLGGEFNEHVRQALQESVGGILLGDCGGELVLICKVGNIDPAYKVFRWDAMEAVWMRTMSLGGRTLFIGYDDFVACLDPGVPGTREDCIYASLPWTGGWSEYSLIDGTFNCITAKYPGEPGVGSGRPQTWVLPSLFCN